MKVSDLGGDDGMEMAGCKLKGVRGKGWGQRSLTLRFNIKRKWECWVGVVLG